MKLKIKSKSSSALKSRLKRKIRIRKKIEGSIDHPRLCIYRSNTNMYAQIIDDTSGKTLASASSLKLNVKGKKGLEVAQLVGQEIAKVAKTKNISSVVFDRNGFIYHGKIKALADAARENGLQF